MLTESSLVEACEAALAEAPSDRAPSLLRSLDFVAPDEVVDDLTVGQCDRRLLALRAELFGSVLPSVTSCPRCGQDVEFELSVDDLLAGTIPSSDTRVVVTAGEHRLECRVPTNADLRALSTLGRAARGADLARRCVLAVEGPQGDIPPGDLPESASDLLPALLAEVDDGASLSLAIACPCSHTWEDELDIRSFLWAEVVDRVHRVLGDVHRLAVTYGWSEAEILGLSPWRRRLYLEACGW